MLVENEFYVLGLSVVHDLIHHFSNMSSSHNRDLLSSYIEQADRLMELVNAEHHVRKIHSRFTSAVNGKGNFKAIFRDEEFLNSQGLIPHLDLSSNRLNQLIFNINATICYSSYD